MLTYRLALQAATLGVVGTAVPRGCRILLPAPLADPVEPLLGADCDVLGQEDLVLIRLHSGPLPCQPLLPCHRPTNAELSPLAHAEVASGRHIPSLGEVVRAGVPLMHLAADLPAGEDFLVPLALHPDSLAAAWGERLGVVPQLAHRALAAMQERGDLSEVTEGFQLRACIW